MPEWIASPTIPPVQGVAVHAMHLQPGYVTMFGLVLAFEKEIPEMPDAVRIQVLGDVRHVLANHGPIVVYGDIGAAKAAKLLADESFMRARYGPSVTDKWKVEHD